jgi:hydroxymethylpyrimidine pyrophosphatase-like HAD family hydrolase
MKFKAALFDFDGTVTNEGQYAPTKELSFALLKLARKMPIGFCTGRQLDSFVERGLTHILEVLDEKDHEDLLKNLFLFGENGAVGYHYDLESMGFKEFYNVAWPEEFLAKDKFKEDLEKLVLEYGMLYQRAHKIVVVIRTKHHYDEWKDMKEVYRYSGEIYKICCKFLEDYDSDYEKHLHVGNSGIGVVVGPAGGDKDIGIRKFGEYLVSERGIELGEDLREILAVGDRPLYGGNDHYFLKGEVGTPYSVGDLVEGAEFPLAVLGEKGERLFNANGTLALVEKILAG